MTTNNPQNPAVDPVTLEILRANFVSVTDEMKTNLRRTAYNQIIYEAQDFTVGLFDADGHTVSIGLGLPMFVGGLSKAIKAKIAHYGIENLAPGDILLTNDAYIMGSHLNHMIFTLPIFAEGRVIAFASSMAHWLDVGGVLGGTTQDIYSEGLQVPIVKIFKAGVQDDEITRIIETNVRFSDLAMGDLRAQVAAIRTGERRLLEMVDRYGVAVITRSFDLLYDRSEALARQAVAAIPDGEYVAETSMDDDGVNIGVPVPIKVTVRIAGDQMTIDLSEVSPQVAGYFNSGAVAGTSAAQVAFKFLTSPDEYPVNEGSLRPVDVVLPPGRVVSALKPAAMRWWMTYPMTIVDCVFRALAGAHPNGTIAGHHADLGVIQLYGTDENGRFVFFNHGGQGGGWGATRDKDGENASICVNDGDTHNTPIEAIEAKYPSMMIDRYALRPDSGGAGTTRGGLGTVLEVRPSTSVRLNTFIERTREAPWGIGGGEAAAPNRVSLIRADGSLEKCANGKLDGEPVAAGDVVRIETGGGGGCGDPRQRPVDAALADVRAGYVTQAAARDTYGVAVRQSPDGREVVIDEPATRLLRGAASGEGK
jgi:N-methylhydantoinase B